jgi:hypothetical protein
MNAYGVSFFQHKDGGGFVSEANLSVVEHLTVFSTKPKNYRRQPVQYNSYGYSILGATNNSVATLVYTFPLSGHTEVKYSIALDQKMFSERVSTFGVHSSCFGKKDDSYWELKSDDYLYLKTEMNKDGFYFRDYSDFGLDYNHTIENAFDLGIDIARYIVKNLQSNGQDSYLNRVQAVLNFVQFIPYGQPEFDHGDYGYFGFALPWESMAISYADCDSKSALFACILKQLISNDNIVLVLCEHVDMPGNGHMIVGVSDLNYQGQNVNYGNKQYLLLETTIPQSINEHKPNQYLIQRIIPINA